MSLGAKLKQAREALGMSEHDVADKTHIMVQIIRELEAEDYHRFSAAIYGKGFVKLYAKAVGLDPAPLVAEFLSDYADAAAPKQKPRIVLETIDTEPGGGISHVVTAGGTEHPQERKGEEKPKSIEDAYEAETPEKQNEKVPTPASSLPPSVKASTVTMPNPNAKPVTLTPGRPAAMRAIPTPSPSQAPAPEPAPMTQTGQVEPQYPVTETETQQSENVFKLEADNVVPTIPPRPVKRDIEPFRYPTSQKSSVTPTQNQAPRPGSTLHSSEGTVEDEDASELFAEQQPRRRRQTAPRIHARKDNPRVGDFVRHFSKMVSDFVSSVKERISEIGSADSEDTHVKRRYYISTAAVLMVVVLIVIVAINNSGKRSDSDVTLATTEPSVDGVIEEAGSDYSPNVASDEIATSDVPAVEQPLSVEIVSILPPPKMFAK